MTDAIICGDPLITRWAKLNPRMEKYRHLLSGLIEIPCQRCGRMVVLSPSGQEVALEGGQLVMLDKAALARNEINAVGEPVVAGPMAAICMWCAFAGDSQAIEKLDSALRQAKSQMGVA